MRLRLLQQSNQTFRQTRNPRWQLRPAMYGCGVSPQCAAEGEGGRTRQCERGSWVGRRVLRRSTWPLRASEQAERCLTVVGKGVRRATATRSSRHLRRDVSGERAPREERTAEPGGGRRVQDAGAAGVGVGVCLGSDAGRTDGLARSRWDRGRGRRTGAGQQRGGGGGGGGGGGSGSG